MGSGLKPAITRHGTAYGSSLVIFHWVAERTTASSYGSQRPKLVTSLPGCQLEMGHLPMGGQAGTTVQIAPNYALSGLSNLVQAGECVSE